VTSHDSTALNTSRFDGLHAGDLEDEGPPWPWTDRHIGDTGVRGISYHRGLDNIYPKGAGADIWGTSDAFIRRAGLAAPDAFRRDDHWLFFR
jgi:hypothetical protein